MKKTNKKQEKTGLTKNNLKPIDLLFGVIIILYIIIPTFTPNLLSLDTNTPKFAATALLNLLVFSLMVFNGYLKNHAMFVKGFFTQKIGLVYSLFLLVSLLSFTQSVNVLESVLQFTKLFTVFAAVFNLTVILMKNLQLARIFIYVMIGLLIFDAVSVFYNINKFINGEIKAISDIKTVYSNKNILASSIYVKLPFAIWLLVFEKRYLKALGWLGLACGIAATFFMATRAFYLGLALLSLVFIAYALIIYFRQKQRSALWLLGNYVSAFAIAYLAFSFTQQNLYPKTKTKSRHTQGVVEQVATLKDPKTASTLRLDAWRWSFDLIKEKPLLGVGSGNWKVAILKHENQKNSGFIYLYKAHNDFIETTAETGIFGGLLYLGIFIFIIWNFLRNYLKNKSEKHELMPYLFLAASGIIFYSVDAFFNFPADRPEILALFACFTSVGIASAYHQAKPAEPAIHPEAAVGKIRNQVRLLSISLAFVILVASAFILYVNFMSSKTQRIVYQEIMAGKLKEKSDRIIAGFPFIPNVSIWGESIGTLKARYLIDEEKNAEAIEILRSDFSSPWDARREFFMAMAFNNMKEYDSALYYSEIAARLKPNYFRNIHLAASILEKKGETERAAGYYDKYLEKNKKEKQAYLIASNLYIQHNQLEKANEIIEEAMKYHKSDTLVQKQHRFINHKLKVEPYMSLFNQGSDHFKEKRYAQAVKSLSEFIEKVPDYANAFQIRAFCYYYLKDYEKCITDANSALKLDKKNSSLVNLRGVCYRALNKHEEACRDFKKSMEMGNENGKTNYDRFCLKTGE